MYVPPINLVCLYHTTNQTNQPNQPTKPQKIYKLKQPQEKEGGEAPFNGERSEQALCKS